METVTAWLGVFSDDSAGRRNKARGRAGEGEVVMESVGSWRIGRWRGWDSDFKGLGDGERIAGGCCSKPFETGS